MTVPFALSVLIIQASSVTLLLMRIVWKGCVGLYLLTGLGFLMPVNSTFTFWVADSLSEVLASLGLEKCVNRYACIKVMTFRSRKKIASIQRSFLVNIFLPCFCIAQ